MRAITNTPIKNTEGKDSRVTLHDLFDKQGLPKGTGNQVSVEFNLLYRLHLAIPKTDTEWLQESYQEYFPTKDPTGLSEQELLKELDEYAQANPRDPSQRIFGKLKRGEDGALSEADLLEVWLSTIEKEAGMQAQLPPFFLCISRPASLTYPTFAIQVSLVSILHLMSTNQLLN